MGQGFEYHCRKCKKEYAASFGGGMRYPTVYERIMDEMRSGKYGLESQKLVSTIPYCAVDASKAVYLCKKCNKWEVLPSLSLYAPRDMDHIQRKLELYGQVLCPNKVDLKYSYRIVYRHYHKCSLCGSRMRKLSLHEAEYLPCPRCGEINKGSGVLWD